MSEDVQTRTYQWTTDFRPVLPLQGRRRQRRARRSHEPQRQQMARFLPRRNQYAVQRSSPGQSRGRAAYAHAGRRQVSELHQGVTHQGCATGYPRTARRTGRLVNQPPRLWEPRGTFAMMNSQTQTIIPELPEGWRALDDPLLIPRFATDWSESPPYWQIAQRDYEASITGLVIWEREDRYRGVIQWAHSGPTLRTTLRRTARSAADGCDCLAQAERSLQPAGPKPTRLA